MSNSYFSRIPMFSSFFLMWVRERKQKRMDDRGYLKMKTRTYEIKNSEKYKNNEHLRDKKVKTKMSRNRKTCSTIFWHNNSSVVSIYTIYEKISPVWCRELQCQFLLVLLVDLYSVVFLLMLWYMPIPFLPLLHWNNWNKYYILTHLYNLAIITWEIDLLFFLLR